MAHTTIKAARQHGGVYAQAICMPRRFYIITIKVVILSEAKDLLPNGALQPVVGEEPGFH